MIDLLLHDWLSDFGEEYKHLLMLMFMLQCSTKEDNRELMRAWLINQLNANSITGLEWHDGQRNCFRVPWVHGSRRCWNKNDGEVFMKWALHTGMFY